MFAFIVSTGQQIHRPFDPELDRTLVPAFGYKQQSFFETNTLLLSRRGLTLFSKRFFKHHGTSKAVLPKRRNHKQEDPPPPQSTFSAAPLK